MEERWEKIGPLLRSNRTIPTPHPRWEITNPAANPALFSMFNPGILFEGVPSSYRSTSGYVLRGAIARFWSSAANGQCITLSGHERVSSDVTAPKAQGQSVRLCREATPAEMLLPNLNYLTPYTGNDGKTYKTFRAGGLVWLAENLCETLLNDLTPIPVQPNQTSWNALTAPGMCYPDNNIDLAFTVIEESAEQEYTATLKEMFINFYISLYQNPRNSLSAALNSNNVLINPFAKILTEKHTKKDYIMNACSWNVYRNTYQGQWHEIGEASTEPFIQLGSYSDDYDLTERT